MNQRDQAKPNTRKFLVRSAFVGIALILIIIILKFPPRIIKQNSVTGQNKTIWADWTGFGEYTTISQEIDGNGKLVKTVNTITSGKTFFDGLSVLVVPVSLAGLGFLLQQL